MDSVISALLEMQWLEFIGLVSGLLCVWLLIKENIWTFPIGLVYAVVSVIVMARSNLYADTLLNVYYVVMNGYGWYYWSYSGARSSDDNLIVTNVPLRIGVGLTALVVVGTFAMGWFLDTRTDADLAYWDSLTTVMSFAAMWMTARKYIENWIVWLVVDVVATVMYVVKGLDFYAILYGVYLGMAVWGFLAWRRSLLQALPSV